MRSNVNTMRFPLQVLHEHIAKLAQVVTPSHKDLRIPKIYRYECPWPSAQAELVSISAYKTPRDKVACVIRCAATIMNLLSLAAAAAERGIPAADDFIPVCVFVIIKVIDPFLLSCLSMLHFLLISALMNVLIHLHIHTYIEYLTIIVI